MSSNIDERIVQMEFDNGQFERGVRQSTKTLEEFQDKLQFKDATKGLKQLEEATSSFSMDALAQSIANIEARFTNMGIMGQRVLQRIADSAVDYGKKILKSLTIDPVKTGWGKYAEMTQSVQTIMNAIDGITMEEVESQLDMLAWYTDETSYHFSDMVANIGKFTSVGQSLGTSVRAIIGIANACAVAGAGAAKADIAMYNFSQAMAQGRMTALDWKSVGSTAGLSTKEFKTTVIETAKALGKLTKEGKTAKGTLVTYQNFEKTLNEGWYDKEVIIASLEKYGEFVEKAYQLVQEGKAETASEAIRMITDDTYQLGKKAFIAAQEAKTFSEAIEAAQEAVASGWMDTFQLVFGNYEEAKVLWTDLANALYDIFAAGVKDRNELLKVWHTDEVHGYKKAVESVYKILGALWSVVEAVKAGFREIFPPATVDTFYKITDKLAEMADYLEEILWIKDRVFGEMDFRVGETIQESFDKAMRKGDKSEGVKKLQERLMALGYDVGEKMADGIWGPDTEKAFEQFQKDYGLVVDGIYGKKSHSALIEALNVLAEQGQYVFEESSVTEYSDALDKVLRISSGIASVFDIIRKVIGGIWTVATDIFDGLSPTANNLFTLAAHIGDALVALDKWIDDAEIIKTAVSVAEAWAKPYVDQINMISSAILHFFGFGDEADDATSELTTFWDIFESVKKSLEENGTIEKIKESWESLKGTFKTLKETIKGYWETVRKYIVDKFNGAIDSAVEWAPKVMTTLGNGLSSALGFISKIIGKIPKGIDAVVDWFTKLYNSLAESETVKKAGEDLQKAWGSIVGVWDGIMKLLFGDGNKEDTKKDGKKTWLAKFFESIREFLPDLIGKAGSILAKVLEWVATLISNIPTNLKKIKNFFVDLYDKLKSSEKVQSVIEKVKSIFETVKKTLKDIWDNVIKFIFGDENKDDIAKGEKKSVFVRLWEAIKTFLFGADSEDIDRNDGKRGFLGKVTAVYESVRAWFDSVIPTLKGYYETARTWLVEKFTTVSSWVQENAPGIIENIGTALSSAFTWISEAIAKVPSGVESIKTFFIDLYEKLKSSEKVQSVIETVKSVAKSVKEALGSVWESISSFLFGSNGNDEELSKDGKKKSKLKRAIENIRKFFLSIYNKLKKSKWLKTIINSIKTIIDWLREKIAMVWNALKSLFSPETVNAGKDKGIEGEKPKTKFGKIVENVINFFIDTYEKLKKSETFKNLMERIKHIIEIVKEIIIEIWESIISFFDPTYDAKSKRAARKKKRKKSNNEVAEASEEVEEEASLLEIIWVKIKSTCKHIFKVISEAIQSVMKGIASVWESLGSYRYVLVAVGAIVLFVVLIGKLFRPITNLIDGLATLKSGYRFSQAQGLSGLTDMFQMLAILILVIAGSIFVLGKYMNDDEFKRGKEGFLWIAGVITGIGVIFYVLSRIPGGSVALAATSTFIESLKSLGIAIALIAAVVFALSKMTDEDYKTGRGRLEEIGGLFLAAVFVISLLSRLAGGGMGVSVNASFKGLMNLALAIGILVGIVYLVGKYMTPEQIEQGESVVLKLVGLMAGIILVTGLFTKGQGSINVKGMLGVAVAIGVMAYCIKMLGKMDKNALDQGLYALLIVSGLITALMAVGSIFASSSGNVWSFLSLIVLFGGIAVIIAVIKDAIKEVKDVDYKVILSFLGGMTAVVGIIGGLSLAIGKIKGGTWATIKGSFGLSAAFAIVVGAVSAVLYGLGKINEEIGNHDLQGKDLKSYILAGGEVLEAIGVALKPIEEHLGATATIAGLLLGGSILSGVGVGFFSMIGGSLGLSIAFGIVIGVLGSVLYWIGRLDEYVNERGGSEELTHYIEDGGRVLAAIGGAIGSFVGAFTSGFASETMVPSYLTEFGDGVSALRVAAEGLGTDDEIVADVSRAIEIVSAVDEYFKTLGSGYEFTSHPTLEGYATAPAQLASDILAFGGAMTVLRAGINSISSDTTLDEDKATAIRIANEMWQFFKDLEDYTIYPDELGGYYTAPEQLSTDIGNFGLAMENFRRGVNGAVKDNLEADTTSALAAASKVSSFFIAINTCYDDMKLNMPTLDLFNRRVTSMLSNIETFGTTMESFATALKTGDVGSEEFTENATNAIAIANEVATFLIGLEDPSVTIEAKAGVLKGLFTDKTKGETVFDDIGTLGTNMAKASRAMGATTIDLVKFGYAIHIADELVRILTTISGNSITSEHVNALNNIINDIVFLGTSINTLNGQVKDISISDETGTFDGAIEAALKFLDTFVSFANKIEVAKSEEGTLSGFEELIDYIGTLGDKIKNLSSSLGNNVYKLEPITEFLNTLQSALFTANAIPMGSAKSALSEEIGNIIAALTDTEWKVLDTEAIAAKIKNSIDTSIIEGIGTAICDSVAKGMLDNNDTVFEELKTIISDLPSVYDTYKSTVETVGKNFDYGIAAGIRSGRSSIISAVREVMMRMIGEANDVAKIASPSREGMDIGMYFDLGISRGLYDYSDEVTYASKKVMTDLIGSAADTVAVITQMINEDMDEQPVIRPVLDLSDITTNAQRMNGLFGNRTIGLSGAELAAKVQTNANAVPIGSKNMNNVNDTIQTVNDRLDNLGEAMTHLKVVMDSGVVAGEISPYVDKNLGKVIQRRGRG